MKERAKFLLESEVRQQSVTLRLEEVIRELVTAQRGLIGALSRQIVLSGLEYVNDLQPGQVTHGGASWDYRGHGAGIRFEREGQVVDAAR